jgi:protein-S-isoprenylcysteine O-methyltransferase Ste14
MSFKFDKRLLQRIRVPLGFLSAIIVVVFARPTALTIAIGSGVAIIGLLIRGWASGHIRKAEQLATGGPYAFTRNPLYLGSFIIGIGFTVATGVWWMPVAFCIVFAAIYFPVMLIEASDVREIFGSEFDEYERNVPLFFPRLSAWKPSGNKFDFQLYLRYREYRAAIGTIVAIAVLAADAYFLR